MNFNLIATLLAFTIGLVTSAALPKQQFGLSNDVDSNNDYQQRLANSEVLDNMPKKDDDFADNVVDSLARKLGDPMLQMIGEIKEDAQAPVDENAAEQKPEDAEAPANGEQKEDAQASADENAAEQKLEGAEAPVNDEQKEDVQAPVDKNAAEQKPEGAEAPANGEQKKEVKSTADVSNVLSGNSKNSMFYNSPSNANGYAIDVLTSVSQSTFSCLYSYGYNIVFARIYGPQNGGQTDSVGINNIYNANAAGLGYEVFVTPSTTFVKSGSTQFKEAFSYATNQGLQINRVWLQVTSPVNWSTDYNSNVELINSFIETANQNNVDVGIYTNWYDWSQITDSSSLFSSIYGLWYWNANGIGVKGETAADFTDFVSFASFSSVVIKQYGVGETVCSTNVNVNVYSTSIQTKANSVNLSALKDH